MALPDYKLAQQVHLVQVSNGDVQDVIQKITEQEMAPYYYHLYNELSVVPWDQSLYDDLVGKNKLKIDSLKDDIKRLESEDDSELDILKKWTELGEYYAQIGDKSNALTTLLKTIEIAPSTGSKIDLYLTISRIGFFFTDLPFVKKYLDLANTLIEKGGDWERRNRYKTYLGIYHLSTRDFLNAAKLLTESLSTFTSTELTSYEDVAQYCLIAGALNFDRPDLKKKLLDSPEIISVLSQTPKIVEPIYDLIKSLYSTDYKSFFPALLNTNEEILLKDRFLAPHAAYYLREIRVRAYAQLLESYRSLSLKSMASQFGVSVSFLDDDLCAFIRNKKLFCVIDRVGGIVETNRADGKEAQYENLIRLGDGVLTKLQKYGGIVRLSGE